MARPLESNTDLAPDDAVWIVPPVIVAVEVTAPANVIAPAFVQDMLPEASFPEPSFFRPMAAVP